MTFEIVGDRFVQEASGSWMDLATGDPVNLAITALGPEWEERARTLEGTLAMNCGDLLDFGRLGVSRWFEASAARPTSRTTAEARITAAIADEVMALASGSSTRGIQFFRPSNPPPSAPDTARAIARRLCRLGFVCVRAGIAVSPVGLVELEHRHLAVLLFSQSDRHQASHWIRRLARISVRGHLLVDLTDPSRDTGGIPCAVRERAPELWGESRESRAGSPRRTPALDRLERATVHAGRGRGRDAERWYQAALESGRRHRSEAVQLTACRELMTLQIRREAWGLARGTATNVLEDLNDPTMRSEVCGLLATVLIACGELAPAEALLASAITECQVLTGSSLSLLRERQAELRFWQGRFEEATDLLAGLPLSTSALAVNGLVCWARGDLAGVNRARSALGRVGAGNEAGAFWMCALQLLADALDESVLDVQQAVRALESAGSATECLHLARLGRVIRAEVRLAKGQREDALIELGPRSAWAGAPVRDWLLRERIEGAIRNETRTGLARRLERTGLFGLRRWGLGRGDMQLVHALPTVLELVHDAEDELAALTGACHWMRRECHAEVVAFLSSEDTNKPVASDGWTTTDRGRFAIDAASDGVVRTDGQVTAIAPVRYAGVRIGALVARGPKERSATLADTTKMVAALCAAALRARLDAVRASRQSQSLTPEILGRSPSIASLKDTIGRAAATPFAVLIEGESGTGKELVARAIHRLSPRRDRRFAAINCAAISDELVEAELFGHARGAFTGAIGPRTGLFEDAHAGSLFLDEVSELSARAQAKLLRVLQEREVRRVGENTARPIDVRVIAATNRSLAEAVRQGGFREDLLFRLAVVRIRLPALRERVEDIPILADAYWRSLSHDARKRAILGPDALASLCRHRWPGNVRELQNAVAALVVLAPERGRVGARHVAQVIDATRSSDEDPGLPLEYLRTRCERRAVSGALARHGGRRVPAAHELGLTRQGLTKAMKRLGLMGRDSTAGVA